MKKRLISLILVAPALMLLISCSNKGDCTLVYTCDTGTSQYSGTSSMFDITEDECNELAADFEQGGQCVVDSDWQEEQ